MAVQWYPGHMYKASKEIRESMPGIDLVIEVLDARIPYSSENPVIKEVRGDKPCIKILNKYDLADPVVTKLWQEYLELDKTVKTLVLSTEQPAKIQQIAELCQQLLPEKVASGKTLHTMIMGIPNVGKSTLINILAGRQIAKTGNEPAVTKRQQRIRLDNDIYLSDTPGILWPKVENPKSSYRLAVTGAIKDTAIEYDDVAFFAAEYFLQTCPELIVKRYDLDKVPESELDLLETMGRKRGCIGGGGMVDLHKASVILINEYRNATLGRISLETPEMAEAEKIEAIALMEAKAIKDADRIEKSKKKRRKRK